jgi:hypothetical protein
MWTPNENQVEESLQEPGTFLTEHARRNQTFSHRSKLYCRINDRKRELKRDL